MRSRVAIVLAAMALVSVRLAAHDFWLAAAQWIPGADGKVTITAGVGERFPIRTNFRSRDNWLAEWRIVGSAGDVPVSKDFRRTDLVMATEITLPAPGAYLGVAMVSAQTIEMKGSEFTDYLKEESLDRIIEARRAAGEAEKTTKERYARYAKIALRTGAGSGAHLTRPAGLKAEFIPASDPTSVHPGGSLTVQFLADGKPVADAVLSAVPTGDGAIAKATTDRDGRATFKIDREGAWLIKTVHMVRLSQPAEAEWESFWVTLSFHTASH